MIPCGGCSEVYIGETYRKTFEDKNYRAQTGCVPDGYQECKCCALCNL